MHKSWSSATLTSPFQASVFFNPHSSLGPAATNERLFRSATLTGSDQHEHEGLDKGPPRAEVQPRQQQQLQWDAQASGPSHASTGGQTLVNVSQDEVPEVPLAVGCSRTGSNSSAQLNLELMGTGPAFSHSQHSQSLLSSGGSPVHAHARGPPCKASSHPPAHYCLNGGDQADEEDDAGLQLQQQLFQQQRWRSVPLPLFSAQPQRSDRQGSQGSQAQASAASSASSSSQCPCPTSPHTAPLPPSAPTSAAQAPASSCTAPPKHRLTGSNSCSQVLHQGSRVVPPPKTASFNHNLRHGRREELFVRNSCDYQDQLTEDPDGNSSDDAAEERATWELLSRRSSAEQAASVQRRSVESQKSHHRRKLSSASLPAITAASSLDLGDLTVMAAAEGGPAVVQAELQHMQQQLAQQQQQQGQQQQQQEGSTDPPTAAGPHSTSSRRLRSSYHLTHGQAAVELFLRLSRARQTLDFVRRQASTYACLNHARMSMWEALNEFSGLREYEAALFDPAGELLDPDMPLMQHALQSAELCRLNHPDKDWMHLAGLIHGLGKLLAHPMFGSQPQWAICGESFPVGCRFDPHVSGSQFYTVNPDRRRRLLNTQTGIYKPRCGLQHVFMSWGAPEFLYLMLSLNLTRLPPEALFLIRCQKFYTLTKTGGSHYHQLLSPEDEALLPLLRDFQRIIAYRRVPIPDHARLKDPELYTYYKGLIEKYVPGVLLW